LGKSATILLRLFKEDPSAELQVHSTETCGYQGSAQRSPGDCPGRSADFPKILPTALQTENQSYERQ
jgi:hypothetical protein